MRFLYHLDTFDEASRDDGVLHLGFWLSLCGTASGRRRRSGHGTLLEVRSSTIAGVLALYNATVCTKALGITLLPFDLTSGAIYLHLARILLDMLDHTWSLLHTFSLTSQSRPPPLEAPYQHHRTGCILMHATCNRRQRF